MNSFEETESLCFQSDDNIIKKILDNKSDYTELRIEEKHVNHFYHNKSEYLKLYGQRTESLCFQSFEETESLCFQSFEETESLCSRSSDFILLIMNALVKNQYINGIYVTQFCNNSIETYIDLLSAKMFTSIYIGGNSQKMLQFLNTNENKVEKLKLSSIALDEFKKIPETCKLLKSLDVTLNIPWKMNIDGFYFQNKIFPNNIFEIINRTNITELILCIDRCAKEIIEQCNVWVTKNKSLRSLHVKNIHRMHHEIFRSNVSNNYILLNFTINGECDEKITNIMNRNKKYMMTILLCMNKKIIPRCVFKSMILIHVV